MLAYLSVRCLTGFLRFVPLRVLHATVSPLLRFLLQLVFRYRLRTVRNNLRLAFPTEDAYCEQQTGKYYHHLADLLVETIKGLSMSQEELSARFRYLNADIFDPYYEQGRDILLLGAHLSNWEWGVATFPTAVRHQVTGIYKPLRNQRLNVFLLARRCRWGLRLLPLAQAGRAMAGGRDRPGILVLIADQRPARADHAVQVEFFGRKTPFHRGPEKLARRFDLPVFTFTVERNARGMYEVRFRLLAENSRELPDGGLVRKYATRLEADIRRQPEAWLWSHRRWKRSPSDGNPPEGPQ
ncbi:MAG: Lipid biosynthesis lauroyl acyltransferase [Bacteroidota bacterium]